jgi:hypothetical protein
MTTLLRSRPVALCPTCTAPLDGGPVLYWCAPCRVSVQAADVPAERTVLAQGHACRPCHVCRSCRICYPHSHPFPPARQEATP